MPTRFEIYRSGDGYRWRLVVDARSLRRRRGVPVVEIAAFGEGQPTMAAAMESIRAAQRMFADAPIEDTSEP